MKIPDPNVPDEASNPLLLPSQLMDRMAKILEVSDADAIRTGNGVGLSCQRHKRRLARLRASENTDRHRLGAIRLTWNCFRLHRFSRASSAGTDAAHHHGFALSPQS